MSDDPALDKLVQDKRVKKAVVEEEKPRLDGGDEVAGFDSSAEGFTAKEFRLGVKWVFEHLQTKVKLKDSPSQGWYDYLKTLQANPKAKLDFFMNVLPKFIPAKAAEEKGNNQDDGRSIVELLRSLRSRRVAQNSTQGTGSQQPIPGGSSSVGSTGQGVAGGI